MQVQDIVATHPGVTGRLDQAQNGAIEARLAEDRVADLRRSIRLNSVCADFCFATARIAIRRTGGNAQPMRRTPEAFVLSRRLCVVACRRCAEPCRNVIPTVGAMR